MSTLAWAIVGGAVLLVYLFAFALFAAASRGDEAIQRDREDR